MGVLINISLLKEYLKEEGSKNDTLLTAVVTRASAIIEAYCCRTFGQATYTEFYDGSGTETLVLRNFPITLPPDIGAVTPTVLEAGTGLVVGEDPNASPAPDILIYKETGRLVGNNRVWQPLRRWYKVTYSAGFVSMPQGIVQACIDLCELILRERERSGIQSKTTGQQTVQYIRRLPDYSQQVLDQFRDPVFSRG